MLRESQYMNFKFNEAKAIQVAGRLITKSGGEMNYMALIKLVYLIDRESLLRYGHPVTGDRVVAMERGPVVSQIFDFVSQKKQEYPNGNWHKYIPRPKPYVYTVKLERAAPDDQLSRVELELIDRVFEQHKNKDEEALVDFVHSLPEWKNPGKGKSKFIPYEEILRAAGVPASEVTLMSENADAVAEMNFLPCVC
jgi:uncharacterized phage-associated protein